MISVVWILHIMSCLLYMCNLKQQNAEIGLHTGVSLWRGIAQCVNDRSVLTCSFRLIRYVWQNHFCAMRSDITAVVGVDSSLGYLIFNYLAVPMMMACSIMLMVVMMNMFALAA